MAVVERQGSLRNSSRGVRTPIGIWTRKRSLGALLFGVSLLAADLVGSSPALAAAPAIVASWGPVPSNAYYAGAHAYLQTLACPAIGGCVAVGTYQDSSSHTQGVLEQQSGAWWTPIETPVPPGAAANPNVQWADVTCSGPSSCVAVGSYVDASQQTQGLLVTYIDSVMTATEASPPANPQPLPNSVVLTAAACDGPGSCVVVGSFLDTNRVRWPMVESLSGGTWSTYAPSVPADAQTVPNSTAANLSAVACGGAGSCVASGEYSGALGNTILLESIGTSAGSPMNTTRPSDAYSVPNDYLNGVACGAPGDCVAFGAYQAISGSTISEQTLLETESGGTWTGVTAPTPHSDLNSGSCGAPGSCTVVGSEGGGQGVVETYANGGWTAATAALPADAYSNPSASLWSVSCTSATDCATVGSYLNTYTTQGLIDVQAGTTWAAYRAAFPNSGGSSGILTKVSCSAPGHCVALGLDGGPIENINTSVDTTAPTVSVTSAPPSVTNSRTASIAFGAADADDPASSLTYQCTVDYVTNLCTSPLDLSGLTDGFHQVTITASDPAGNIGDPVYVAWTVDATPPSVTINPAAPFTLANAYTVSWSGTDGSGSGVASYQVRYQTAPYNGAFAAWQTLPSVPASTTSAAIPLTFGGTTCTQVQATDNAGNTSAWTTSACTAQPLDDAKLMASTGWTRVKNKPAYFQGTYSQTSKNGATLTLASATLARVGIVADTCSTCGSVVISVGTTQIGTVHLYSQALAHQVILALPTFATATGKITIKAVVPIGKKVVIDGIALSKM